MRNFPHIDMLRAVAALLVLVYHVCAIGELQLSTEAFWAVPFRYGWIGVDLFLVISGFVITLSAVQQSEKNAENFKWNFMQRRLRRLVPLYVLTCLIFIFLVRPEILSRPLEQLLAIVVSHVLFLQNLSPRTHGVLNGVTWSLALEMQFYLTLILSIKWLSKLGALRSLMLLIAVAWSWRYATTFFFLPGQAIPHLQVIYTTQLPGTLDAFGVGIALALAVHHKIAFSRQWLSLGWKNFGLWFAASVCLLVAAAWQMELHQNYWSYHGMVIFWRTLLAMGFGAILAALLVLPVRGGWALRSLQYLGEISYGLYLWHFLILVSMIQLTKLRGESLLIVLVVGAVILASASWHLMEKGWTQRGSDLPANLP